MIDTVNILEGLLRGIYMVTTINNGVTRRAVVTRDTSLIPPHSLARTPNSLKKLALHQEHEAKTIIGVYDLWRDEVFYLLLESTNFEEVDDTREEYYSPFHDADFAMIGLTYFDYNVQRVSYVTRNPRLIAKIGNIDSGLYEAAITADPFVYYDLMNNSLIQVPEPINAVYISSIPSDFSRLPRMMITEYRSTTEGIFWG